MQIKTFAAVVCLMAGLAQALSGGASALKSLTSKTTRLDSTIKRWGGSIFTALPIILEAHDVLKSVEDTTEKFNSLGLRSEADEKAVVVAAQDADTALGRILDTVNEAQRKFSKLPLGLPIVFGILKALQTSTNKLTREVVAGAPPSSKGQFQDLQGQIKVTFENALNSVET